MRKVLIILTFVLLTVSNSFSFTCPDNASGCENLTYTEKNTCPEDPTVGGNCVLDSKIIDNTPTCRDIEVDGILVKYDIDGGNDNKIRVCDDSWGEIYKYTCGTNNKTNALNTLTSSIDDKYCKMVDECIAYETTNLRQTDVSCSMYFNPNKEGCDPDDMFNSPSYCFEGDCGDLLSKCKVKQSVQHEKLSDPFNVTTEDYMDPVSGGWGVREVPSNGGLNFTTYILDCSGMQGSDIKKCIDRQWVLKCPVTCPDGEVKECSSGETEVTCSDGSKMSCIDNLCKKTRTCVGDYEKKTYTEAEIKSCIVPRKYREYSVDMGSSQDTSYKNNSKCLFVREDKEEVTKSFGPFVIGWDADGSTKECYIDYNGCRYLDAEPSTWQGCADTFDSWLGSISSVVSTFPSMNNGYEVPARVTDWEYVSGPANYSGCFGADNNASDYKVSITYIAEKKKNVYWCFEDSLDLNLENTIIENTITQPFYTYIDELGGCYIGVELGGQQFCTAVGNYNTISACNSQLGNDLDYLIVQNLKQLEETGNVVLSDNQILEDVQTTVKTNATANNSAPVVCPNINIVQKGQGTVAIWYKGKDKEKEEANICKLASDCSLVTDTSNFSDLSCAKVTVDGKDTNKKQCSGYFVDFTCPTMYTKYECSEYKEEEKCTEGKLPLSNGFIVDDNDFTADSAAALSLAQILDETRYVFSGKSIKCENGWWHMFDKMSIMDYIKSKLMQAALSYAAGALGNYLSQASGVGANCFVSFVTTMAANALVSSAAGQLTQAEANEIAHSSWEVNNDSSASMTLKDTTGFKTMTIDKTTGTYTLTTTQIAPNGALHETTLATGDASDASNCAAAALASMGLSQAQIAAIMNPWVMAAVSVAVDMVTNTQQCSTCTSEKCATTYNQYEAYNYVGNNANLCVYVGSKCTLEAPPFSGLLFTGCLRRGYRYCCYPSVFAKVIVKEAYRVLGKNFGSYKNPNCQGLSLDDLKWLAENDKFKEMDLTEIEVYLETKLAGKVNGDQMKSLLNQSMTGLLD